MILGILPFAAAVFLGWVFWKSAQQAPATQRWSLIVIIALGVIMMLIARFGLRSRFFQIPRESDSARH